MKMLKNIHARRKTPLQIPNWILLAFVFSLLILATGCAEGCFFANVNYSCPSILDYIP